MTSSDAAVHAHHRKDLSQDGQGRHCGRWSTSKACPMPSQTGRWKRICVQAKIQGMALRSSMLPAALRLAGRLPMFMRPSSLTGVHAWKNSMKLGLPRTTSLYASHDTCAHAGSQAQGIPNAAGWQS